MPAVRQKLPLSSCADFRDRLLLLDIVLGIVGAVVGGYLFTAIGATGITGFNLYSMFVAIVGATAVLWIYHAIGGR